MSNINQYLLIPAAGMIISIAVRIFIDEKLRKILQAQGKNPNTVELEKGDDFWTPIKKQVEYRKSIDTNLGTWYKRSYTISIVSFVGFALLVLQKIT